MRLWDDSSEQQPWRCVISQLTSLSLAAQIEKYILRSLSGLLLFLCVQFTTAAVNKALVNRVVGFVFAWPACTQAPLLSHVEKCTVSTLKTPTLSVYLSPYDTLTCYVSLPPVRWYPPWLKCLLCVLCVQGVMQDVEILVMPQGYISQCPDLNRSKWSLVLYTLRKHSNECLI